MGNIVKIKWIVPSCSDGIFYYFEKFLNVNAIVERNGKVEDGRNRYYIIFAICNDIEANKELQIVAKGKLNVEDCKALSWDMSCAFWKDKKGFRGWD